MFTAKRLSLLGALAVSTLAQPFVGAPEPGVAPTSPVPPEEQRSRFTLPPGFEIELVTSEEQGVGKPITVAWDDAGRLWTITALEYPLDGNEQPEEARALYARGGRDRVLFIDRPYGPGPHIPCTFADNLAMPMGVLPYKDGAIVGHGPDLLFLRDTDGDGRADQREVILTGFGIQDSHLMPHQFTRIAGGWFYLAQGAFNYSRVKTRDGREHQFDQTRLARFTVDGMKFEDLTSGPCNIWGLVINQRGEGFIQEANDYGYPVMALQHNASYPGCTGAYKPYAPYFPSEVDFRMGGTGLSGLALSDAEDSFPGAYADVMYVANPITRKIQAIRIHPEGPWYRYEKLPDFVLSSDEWFRPVAIHFGPDNCLYIIDWYNKIISHNEVPRTHPERDKTRGRIWRVRHKDQPRRPVPNVAAAANATLLEHLRSKSTWEMRAAWHQIVDRPARELVPDLLELLRNGSVPERIHALWVLEELRALPFSTIRELSNDPDRNIRREAIRALENLPFSPEEELAILRSRSNDPDPQVRAEVIRVASAHGTDLLLAMVSPALAQPSGRNPHSGAPMKLREAYDREFERYLIRSKLEGRRFDLPDSLPAEARLLGALALNTPESTRVMIELLAKIDRNPNEEELLRVLENVSLPGARETLAALLARPAARPATFEALLKVRNRLDAASIAPLLAAPLREFWSDNRELAARVAGAFKVTSLADQLDRALAEAPVPIQLASLRALREMDRGNVERVIPLARGSDRQLREEALNFIASSDAPSAIVDLWPRFNPVQRRAALRKLTATAENAEHLLATLREANGSIHERDLDAASIEKLQSLFPNSEPVKQLAARLLDQFKPVLQLTGDNDAYIDSNITLQGPFTVETWVRLDPGINNNDSILGAPGRADFNFHDSRFRVHCGPEFGDRVVARRPMSPNSWTHLAVTRDSEGAFRLYINGELDSTDPRPVTNTFAGLDIGRSSPAGGTAGTFTEYRVWNRARSAAEIRAQFDRSFAGEPLSSGLVFYASGAAGWGTLKGAAQIEKTLDAPALLSAEEARAQEALFARYRALASHPGDPAKGKAWFASACMTCHSVDGQGAQIGPVLNGAAANGLDSLLRAILTPNAAMEAGYRTFRIELTDGETVEGFLVSQTDDAYVLRQPNAEDQRIARDKVRRAEFTRQSLMPEGILQALPDTDARDLLAYLQTLK